MTRRTAERHQRRIEVRFWRRGNAQAHSGYTIDVSRSGLFLGTSVPLDPGERLRLELLDRESGFVIEGEVARVHRVSLALRHVEQPGVGVRFVPPAELVAQLVAGSKARVGTTIAQQLRVAGPLSPSRPPSAGPPPAAPELPPVAPAAAAAARELEDLFGAAPATEGASGAERPAAPPAPPVSGTPAPRAVAVEFVDRASFLSVYHRDIAAGGLFVTTDTPAALYETVTIELRPPVRTANPLRFEARVVHRFDPADGSAGKAGLSGMGVQFLDPDRVRAALAPVVVELRR